ncbi:MAG: ABC-F family ATP-binding cassette domain-containing protein [Desulfuromonadaceae bacterium]|nr:ABC-F family ATP-binding cassette domain-containing protein [Desulfuromonadaceae bacterium]
MIHIKDISKDFGGREVLSGVSWFIGNRTRIGLCGPNGAGKTTLLRILSRELEPDRGEIDAAKGITIGYLPQLVEGIGDNSLFSEVRSALAELEALERELKELEGGMASRADEAGLERYAALQELFRLKGGYTMESDTGKVLDGLGFARADWEKPCSGFSGGWQMRIALAKLLLRRPHLLLLDEPTNHLDLATREWLESFLQSYPFSLVVVSHDRHFLDQVVEKIIDIWNGGLQEYSGNYSAYLTERERRIESLREAKRRQDEEIARIENFISRFRYQANKASLVQSRVKQLEKIDRIDLPPQPKRIGFRFPPSPKGGKDVLRLSGISHGYGPLTVLEGVDLPIGRGERVALAGPNGAGKSTLMRLLAGVETPWKGERREGEGLRIGYFAQNQAALLDAGRTVLAEITEAAPFDMVPRLRNLLGGFLFSNDDVDKKVAVLSGGERNRLAFAKLLLKPRNLLLLDEPTNHLDIDSKEVLLDTLRHFDGTMVFVSHDRYFVDQLATRVLEVGQGKVLSYPGNYGDFLQSKQSQGDATHSGERVECRSAAPAANGEDDKKAERRQEHRERRDAQREERKRLKEIETLEETIAEREEELAALEKLLADPVFYGDAERFTEAIHRHEDLRREVDRFYLRWEELQAGGAGDL